MLVIPIAYASKSVFSSISNFFPLELLYARSVAGHAYSTTPSIGSTLGSDKCITICWRIWVVSILDLYHLQD